MIMPAKIQSQFKLLATITVLTVAAFAGVHFLASQTARAHSSSLLSIASITQRHMEGDMMHDAMNSDVLASLLAAKEGDKTTISGAGQDLKSHYEKFRENLTANQAEELPADIQGMFDAALNALNAYYAAGDRVIQNAAIDGAIETAFEEFNTRFDAMETENEAISDAIAAWAEKEQASAVQLTKITNTVSSVLALIACGLVLAIPWFGQRKIFRPLGTITDTMLGITEKRYSDVLGTDRQDEIGDIARCVDIFQTKARERDALEVQRADDVRRNAAERRDALLNLANEFEARIQGVMSDVTSAAAQLSTNSQGMMNQVNATSDVAQRVSSSTTQTIQNVNNVAAAANQMTVSIREIAEQITSSNTAVQSAVTEMDTATETSQMLETATNRIGEIVVMIQGITNQINLLSLNATIESARAGEAGKGFAVVANEVKTLADQAAKATEEISRTINNIRDVSGQVVKTIHTIKGTIDTVYSVSSSISAAVEEQSAASNDIADNIGRASSENERIAADIETVSTSTQSARGSASSNAQAADALSNQARRLDEEFKTFLKNVRSA